MVHNDIQTFVKKLKKQKDTYVLLKSTVSSGLISESIIRYSLTL